MTEIYFRKIKEQNGFEEFLIIFDEWRKPLVMLDKHDMDRLLNEWSEEKK